MKEQTDNRARLFALVKVLHKSRLLPYPEGSLCALCGHEDCGKEIVRTSLTEEPICWVCHMELEWFAHEPRRRSDNAIVRIEDLTGKPWSECRMVLLRDCLSHLREIMKHIDRLGLTDESMFACPGRDAGASIGEHIRIVEDLLNPANNVRR